MKKIYLSACIVLNCLFCNAQNVPNGVADMHEQCLFSDFSKGAVLMKNGSIEDGVFNYNTADQSVVFEKNSDAVFTLTHLEEIDTIYFRNKKFIPGPDGLIYEVIINNSPKISLFVTYTNKLKPATAVTDQSGTTHKEAAEVSNTMTGVYVLRPYKGDYMVEIHKNFWLIKAKQIYKATSAKQFQKVFPHQDDSIKQYIDENQVNFKVEEDLIKLTFFCNSRLSS